MAIFAIGDVHGCPRTLERLLRQLPRDPATDPLWLVGDLVGHGPDSAGAVRVAAALPGPSVTVAGNHDLRLLGAADGVVAKKESLRLAEEILAEPDGAVLLDWLGRRPLLHSREHDVLVHAGLLPSWDLAEARSRSRDAESLLRSSRRAEILRAAFAEGDDAGGGESPPELARAIETVRVMTTIRTLRRDGRLCDFDEEPEKAPPGCAPWYAEPDRGTADATLVFGHWASLGLRLMERAIALDSGCGWGGPLTAVRLEDRRVFQVDRVD
jgi:bis(5'-nucleosyl)-tetraphosphatase (symmetrical)